MMASSKPRWYLFTWQTYLAICVLMFSLLMLNVCGQPDTYEPWDSAVGTSIFMLLGVFQHGWPLVYLRRSAVDHLTVGTFLPSAGRITSPFDVVSNVLDFHPGMLFLNLIVAGILLIGVIYFVEKSCRSQKTSRLRFGIRSLLRITFFVAIWLLWVRADWENIQLTWQSNLYLRLFTYGIDPIFRATLLLPVYASIMITLEQVLIWLLRHVLHRKRFRPTST